MSTLTPNDQNIIAAQANQFTEYLFGTSLNLTPDLWDKSGANIAVTETLGSSLNKLFDGWADVTAYKARQYDWANRVVADAEYRAGQLSPGAAAEADAMRRAAQVTADNMRTMGDRAASGIPIGGASTAANVARAAEYVAAFAKAAGAALAIGQMASKTYDAAVGETTTHDVMGTAVGAVAGMLGGAAAVALGTAALGTALLPAIAIGAAAIGAGFIIGKIGQAAYDHWGQGITDFLADTGRWWQDNYGVIDTVNSLVTAALNWVAPRRDPLVLDLDGSGITTSAINPAAPILFDHDGDGTKTASGWIASGEAIVVRDLNGNNLIDSGRELFGDNTILTRGPRAGQVAANGFEALADLDMDINGVADGKFDAADTAYASVKLWRDLDQDGISQSSELFTFAQLGVASINTTGTTSDVNLGGGNTQTQTGSFTKTDNTAGSAGTAHLAGSLLLANNNFYREFTDDPALSAEAQALPQMQGSGTVRDLRPAMSLGTPQAAALQTALTEFAADTTRAASNKWGDISIPSNDIFWRKSA
jgi:hypothetical protein